LSPKPGPGRRDYDAGAGRSPAKGLRIELLESEVGTFFESGNAQPAGSGKEMLDMLAAELGKMQNKLLIEGHGCAAVPVVERLFELGTLGGPCECSQKADAGQRPQTGAGR
jgi:hypothetical protein